MKLPTKAMGVAAKVAAHAVAGGVMSKLQGGKFGHGFFSAGFTEAVGPRVINEGAAGWKQVAAAAVIGGTASRLSGGKFANGAVTSAFQWAFNHLATSKTARYAYKGEGGEQMEGLFSPDIDPSNDPFGQSGFEGAAPEPAMDIDAAITELNENVLPGSDGWCARHVRWALEAGGVDTTGHPAIARTYGPLLVREGFQIIPSENYAAQRGDVVVFQNYPNQPRDAGHIQVKLSKVRHPISAVEHLIPGPSYNNISYTVYRP
jgi:hypothetical protein